MAPPPAADGPAVPDFDAWLPLALPDFTHDWKHLAYVRSELAAVTRGECDRLAIGYPPQHGKTRNVTVPYPLWRMLREPGLRVAVVTHSQHYADKVSRWTRGVARRLGLGFGEVNRMSQWELANGSTYLARGVGGMIAGEPLDLLVLDDPFGSRKDADSAVIQERVYEYYMDDATPRLQRDAAIVLIHTRWNPGDLIGRILASEEGPEWRYVRLPAVAETQAERDQLNAHIGRPAGQPDPLGRAPGEPLCEARYPLAKLEQKRRIEGVGFESLYQQNPIPRGGTFFERAWFEVVGAPPEGKDVRRLRYWDLARSRKDTACFTAGVLLACAGEGDGRRYYVEDVVRGRWAPGERNEVMLNTARADATRSGFERTWFESPTHDTGSEAGKAILAKLSGHPVRGDAVSGSKEMRAEPLSDAARGRLVKLVAGPWVAAFLTELESFPHSSYKDQVDSSSGAFNKLARGGGNFVVAHAGR